MSGGARRLEAFHHRNFTLYWLGNIGGNIGGWMQQVATGWLVLELTNSPAYLGFNAVFQAFPILLFALVGVAGLLAMHDVSAEPDRLLRAFLGVSSIPVRFPPPKDKKCYYLTIAKFKDGRFLGSSGLHRIDWDVPKFEIGYWCRTSLARRGYITEAVAKIEEYLKTARSESAEFPVRAAK